MIKLFITDLDGCISFPYKSPDWESVSMLRELVEESKTDRTIPPLTICSGRPMPYVEAVAQWLGVYTPMVFESGGGVYDMQDNKILWNPGFDEQTETALDVLKDYLRVNYIETIPHTIAEFSKKTDAGLINPEAAVIGKMHSELRAFVADYYPDFEIHRTDVSINIISKKTNKSAGIRFLTELLSIGVEDVAYIGDTGGDIESLKMVGMSFAPRNAIERVRTIVKYPLEAKTTRAVLEAYQRVIAFNRTGELPA